MEAGSGVVNGDVEVSNVGVAFGIEENIIGLYVAEDGVRCANDGEGGHTDVLYVCCAGNVIHS